MIIRGSGCRPGSARSRGEHLQYVRPWVGELVPDDGVYGTPNSDGPASSFIPLCIVPWTPTVAITGETAPWGRAAMTIERRILESNARLRARGWVGLFALLAAVSIGATACGSTAGASGKVSAGTADGSSSRTASPTRKPASRHHETKPSSRASVVTHRIIRKRERIPFRTRTLDTATLNKGVIKVQQAGRPGIRITVYRVTLDHGVISGRTIIRRLVARQPLAQIKLHGTHVAPTKPVAGPRQSAGCDPNYAGGCVPIASDVDCRGGSGNGPAYVDGPVRVVGIDIYDLDADGDGYGCD